MLAWSVQALKNHVTEGPADVDSPLPLSHSALTSTLEAALPEGSQVTEASQELRAGQNGNLTPEMLSNEASPLQVIFIARCSTSLHTSVDICSYTSFLFGFTVSW